MAYNTSVLPSRIRRPLIARLRRHVALALATRRDRCALLRLEPHLLRDIGLTESEARTEAARPIWDVPQHWRR